MRQWAGLLAHAVRARTAITTRKISNITCVERSSLVANCEAADMNTTPMMVTKSATKAAKIAGTSCASVRMAHATVGTTSKKIITAPMSSIVVMVDGILILNHRQAQACFQRDRQRGTPSAGDGGRTAGKRSAEMAARTDARKR